MKCILFYHAFTSCWNNGNAHFLRGYARALHALGHEVIVFEPIDGWSRD
ncbi:spore maturation protein CgeB [Bradyrhizobium sp. i1.3.1]